MKNAFTQQEAGLLTQRSGMLGAKAWVGSVVALGVVAAAVVTASHVLRDPPTVL